MELYIKVENGQVVSHPAYAHNLMQAFQMIPEGWEPFVRTNPPEITAAQKLNTDDPKYHKANGVWTDLWEITELTAEEKAAKKEQVISEFNNRKQAENWSAWVFDESLFYMVPPIPRPEPDQAKLSQNIFTFWCGADNNWRDTPPMPTENHRFDFLAWQWVVDGPQ